MEQYRLGDHWRISLDGDWNKCQTEDGYVVLSSGKLAIWSVVYLLDDAAEPSLVRYIDDGELGKTELPFGHASLLAAEGRINKSEVANGNGLPLFTHARVRQSSDGYHLFTLNVASDEMLSLEFWSNDSELQWAITAWQSLQFDCVRQVCECLIPQQLVTDANSPIQHDGVTNRYFLCWPDHSRSVPLKFCPWCGKSLQK